MSAMNFREPNQARWLGFRPAHNGSQIIKRVNSVNSLVIMHTVSAGKIFHLCSIFLGVNTLATGTGDIRVQDSGDVFQYILCINSYVVGTSAPGVSMQFWPPLEIPALWDVALRGLGVGLSISGTIFGFEE